MQRSAVKFLLKTIISFAFLFIGHSAFAQGQFTVKLKLVDEKTSAPVAYATASLKVKGEETASKYVLTDDKGAASLTKVKKGTYIFKAELMGYKAYEKEIVVDKNVDLGDIKMAEDAEVLDAASVSAAGNPIIVKKDTIEYNASSFKTSDNDMLEELLKKLPGVEVGTDGSITANGETIKKITIDGKTFFLDDPQLATKNIPAKLINKVKVVEKMSEQAEFTGIDDGNEETIIDLSIRPGMMNGVFGNVMAGGGHDVPSPTNDMNDWRYQGAAMVGRFTDKSQVSLILNANNTNNRGFNDMAGSMMQGMRGGGMGRGMGGWGGGNGITTSWMGGLNGAFNLFDDAMELGGNYLYNGSDRFVEEESSKITYLEDGSNLIYDNKGINTTSSQGHRFGVRLEHKFSEKTSILFEPQVNFGGVNYVERDTVSTFKEYADLEKEQVSKSNTYNTGNFNNWSTSGFLLFRQRIGKPGRTISANIRYSFSNNVMQGFNQSKTMEFDAADEDGTMDVVNQFIDQNSKSASLSGRVVYTEPLTKYLFLEANYQYSWSRSISTKDAFNSGKNPENWDDPLIYDPNGAVKDDIYSSDILNRYINQRAGFNISWQKEKLRAHIGAGITPTNTHNETNGESYDNKVVNWSPQAMVNYQFSENSNVRMFYNGNSAQPSTSQLMPVPNNSNPLNVSFGNPYLKPYFNHNVRLNYGYTNRKSFTSVHANIRGGMVQDAITSAKWYDKKGAQYSIPVNGPGTGNVNGQIMVNSPFGKSDFSIFSMTNVGYNQSTSYIGTDKLVTEDYYDAENADFDYEKFHKDFPTLEGKEEFSVNRTQSMNLMQRLRFTYRNDFVELTAGGRTRMSKSWYTVASAKNTTTWSNQVSGSMNWTIPGGINLIANANYNWYNGYTTPQPDEIIFNAEITKLLFKRTCTLALRAYDIFAQSKNLSVTDNDNYHQEVRNNTLGRYIILSFTYRFGTFGGARGGQGGPGGRGGYGGGRPMGPMGGGMRR